MTTAQSSARASMLACTHNTSEESAGNSLDSVSPDSNIVSDLSFSFLGDTSNRLELSDEDDRSESHEDIRVENNNNTQNSTSHSASEGRNVNDHNEQQSNSTLRRIYLSLEREEIFEEGHDT